MKKLLSGLLATTMILEMGVISSITAVEENMEQIDSVTSGDQIAQEQASMVSGEENLPHSQSHEQEMYAEEVEAISGFTRASGTCGENLTWELVESTGVLTISGVGEMTDYNGYSNYAPWYAYRDSIQTVIVESGVSSIGSSTFYYCGKLTSVSIPEGVESVGSNAFRRCTSLESLNIPSTLTGFDYYVFSSCPKLATAGEVGSGANIEFAWTGEIPEKAFAYSSLQSITLPSNIHTIEAEAFYGSDLNSMTIPETVTTLKESAFQYSEVTTIHISSSVTSIGESILASCYELESITVDSNNPYFSHENGILFSKDKTELLQYPAGIERESYTMPNSVERIASYAFSGCTHIKELHLSNALKTIGERAFSYCIGLTSIDLPSSVTTIGSNAFNECESLASVTIPDSVVEMDWGVFNYCDLLDSAGPINSGSAIEYGWTESIPDFAFSSCDGLLEVSFPDTLRSIGEQSFYYCTKIREIILPEGLETIGSEGFRHCTSLYSVVLPSTLLSFGYQVFVENPYLTTAGPLDSDCNIKMGWTERIPEMVFSYCDYLTEVTIPEGVTAVGNLAFYDCDLLKTVNFPDSLKEIGESAFADCLLSSLELPDGLELIDDYGFAACSFSSVDLPEGLLSLGDGAFSGCSNLNYVYIPASLQKFSYESPFIDCPLLKTAGKVGSNTNIQFAWTEAIPEKAFYNCDTLTSVVIPEGISAIGGYAFRGCTNLSYVSIPSTVTTMTGVYGTVFGDNPLLVTAGGMGSGSNIEFAWKDSIPDYAFSQCQALVSVDIPSGISSIGAYGFSHCNALESVKLSNTLENIDSNAFDYCEKLLTAGAVGSGCQIQYTWTDSIPNAVFSQFPYLTSVSITGGISNLEESAFSGCRQL